MTEPVPDDIRAAYAEADHSQRVRISRIGCVLALVLVPLFWGLDWFVYPERAWELLGVRLLCNALIAVVLGLLFLPVADRYVRVLGVAWAVVPAAAIAWMIFITEGSMSPYYAGLNLAMIIVCLLMPWTFVEVAVLCALVVGLYLTACLFHDGEGVEVSTLVNNLYFMLATAVICCLSGFFAARRRFSEFRLRYELDANNKKLAELDRLKSDFFANVSHELRTPLTLILGPAESLLHRGGDLDEFVTRQLETIRSNGLRLLKLINDLLELIRLDSHSGPGRPVNERVNVAAMADAMAASVRYSVEAKGLRLSCSGSEDALVVRGDESSIERVLLNLLTNATKFTEPDGTIDITWGREGADAVIRVSDTGVGIPREELPFVFDRFRQVDGSSTRRHQGLGLGLALVHDIVKEHRGEIDVTSEVNRGTTFTVRLPLDVEHDPGAAESEFDLSADPTHRDPLIRLHGLALRHELTPQGEPDTPTPERAVMPDAAHVLIVDDEPSMQRYLTDALSGDYNLLHATNGPTALSLARSHRPDLILLDLMLPGADGLEICRQLRGDEAMADTRIILLTARADESSKLMALDRGADDFLTKPFSTLELKTRIRNLLRTNALQRELRQRNHQLEQAIRDLAAARSQLVQSEKMNALGSLAAGLLHEINNPLSFTKAAIQLALDGTETVPAPIRESLEDIGTGIDRVQAVITELRSFAHPRQDASTNRVDVEEAIRTARRFTASVSDHVEFEVEVAEGSYLEASRNQIIQLLVNLLTNAARATAITQDRRPPRVSLASRRTGDHLRLSIRDNGVGIEPDRLSRIFDPFFTTQGVGEGLGLGLSICHTIVTNHGGSISIRSEPDAWTEVVIDLPCQQRVDSAHESPSR